MRVLELSDREDSAAYCGKLFARWGAEVIKFERPSRPAPDRAADLYLNGGKRRVVLDWTAEEGSAALDGLAATCDVVVTDAAAGEVIDHELLALGGDGARAVVSITPFGLDGPYCGFEETPAVLLALGGYTWLMGDGGRAPLTMPGRYPYYQAGTFAYIAALSTVLAGLEGTRRIEVSVLECLASLHQFTDTMWTDQGRLRSRHGNRWENLCPTTLLPCADGWFGLNVLQNFWMPFALMLGHPEYAEAGHPWALNDGRMEHEDEVEAAVLEALGSWTRERILRDGQETWRVPIGAAASLAELLEDRHLVERGFWQSLGSTGLKTAGSPFRFVGQAAPAEPSPQPFSPWREGAGIVEREPALRLTSSPTPIPPPERGRVGFRAGSHSASPTRPLEGLRVLDLTRIWSGPLATRILGDLGADVIKIEAHTNRAVAVGSTGERPWNRQALFNKLSRNKRSVAIDLKAPAAREIFLRLVAECDVVIENFSARAMPSLGLGYDALREANPAIVYLTMPAFGREGPYRDYIGLGPSIEPMTGLTAAMGYSGAEPRVTSAALTDAMSGVAAASAVLTAIERRERTGEGAFIDLSQHEVGVAFLGEWFIERQLSGEEPRRLGNGHAEFAPHGVYRCLGSDDWIALAARTEDEWQALCALASCGWEDDARFMTPEGRRAHASDLDAAIDAWTSTQQKRALMEALQSRDVPAGAVLSPPEWLADPHLEARGYFAELDHAETGRGRWDGSPLRFEGERGYEEWLAAPLLGEHNAAVLGHVLGLSPEAVARLERDGVLADRPPGVPA